MLAKLHQASTRTHATPSAEQLGFLAIVRAATVLADGFEQTLKPFGLSTVQYNVLRILRGAGREGLCRNEIRDRLLTRMPDVTRLLDRMEEAGLLQRERREDDRRQVETRLTRKGREMLIAFWLEGRLTKDEILGRYLSNV